MLQMYVVTAPLLVAAGVDVQLVIPEVPVTDQVVVPVGASAPVIPVTVSVNTKLEPSESAPDSDRAIVGVT